MSPTWIGFKLFTRIFFRSSRFENLNPHIKLWYWTKGNWKRPTESRAQTKKAKIFPQKNRPKFWPRWPRYRSRILLTDGRISYKTVSTNHFIATLSEACRGFQKLSEAGWTFQKRFTARGIDHIISAKYDFSWKFQNFITIPYAFQRLSEASKSFEKRSKGLHSVWGFSRISQQNHDFYEILKFHHHGSNLARVKTFHHMFFLEALALKIWILT